MDFQLKTIWIMLDGLTILKTIANLALSQQLVSTNQQNLEGPLNEMLCESMSDKGTIEDKKHSQVLVEPTRKKAISVARKKNRIVHFLSI